MFAQRIRWLAVLVLALGALVLGAADPTSSAGSEQRYVVRSGDTLWAVAASRYDGDPREAIWRIKERNGLRTSALSPGMVLALPAP